MPISTDRAFGSAAGAEMPRGGRLSLGTPLLASLVLGLSLGCTPLDPANAAPSVPTPIQASPADRPEGGPADAAGGEKADTPEAPPPALDVLEITASLRWSGGGGARLARGSKGP